MLLCGASATGRKAGERRWGSGLAQGHPLLALLATGAVEGAGALGRGLVTSGCAVLVLLLLAGAWLCWSAERHGCCLGWAGAAVIGRI